MRAIGYEVPNRTANSSKIYIASSASSLSNKEHALANFRPTKGYHNFARPVHVPCHNVPSVITRASVLAMLHSATPTWLGELTRHAPPTTFSSTTSTASYARSTGSRAVRRDSIVKLRL